MLRTLLPVISYIIGYIISSRTLFEIKGFEKFFSKAGKILLLIILLHASFIALKTNISIKIMIFFFSFLIFYLSLPKTIIRDYSQLITYSLLGLLIGSFYNNPALILSSSILMLFNSSLDYLKKEELFNLFKSLALMLIFSITALLLNHYAVIIISIAGLVRMLIL